MAPLAVFLNVQASRMLSLPACLLLLQQAEETHQALSSSEACKQQEWPDSNSMTVYQRYACSCASLDCQDTQQGHVHSRGVDIAEAYT